WELRIAQANDSLGQLRDALRLHAYLYIDKDRFQFGQRQNTRSRALIARVDAKKNAATKKYWVARHALFALSTRLGKVGLDEAFPTLRDVDIVHLSKRSGPMVSGRPSEG
ncbi:hypothetical protein C0993_008349, partial [Termitomyces sp. T159_Od127]